jgi:DNA-binding protein
METNTQSKPLVASDVFLSQYFLLSIIILSISFNKYKEYSQTGYTEEDLYKNYLKYLLSFFFSSIILTGLFWKSSGRNKALIVGVNCLVMLAMLFSGLSKTNISPFTITFTIAIVFNIVCFGFTIKTIISANPEFTGDFGKIIENTGGKLAEGAGKFTESASKLAGKAAGKLTESAVNAAKTVKQNLGKNFNTVTIRKGSQDINNSSSAITKGVKNIFGAATDVTRSAGKTIMEGTNTLASAASNATLNTAKFIDQGTNQLVRTLGGKKKKTWDDPFNKQRQVQTTTTTTTQGPQGPQRKTTQGQTTTTTQKQQQLTKFRKAIIQKNNSSHITTLKNK